MLGKKMQISRITNRLWRRYQKAKSAYNWFLQDIQIYLQQQACQWKSQDKSICNIHPKYLHVQLGTMDVEANSGKQHRCISKETAKKNYQCQMTKDDLQ